MRREKRQKNWEIYESRTLILINHRRWPRMQFEVVVRQQEVAVLPPQKTVRVSSTY